MHGGHLLSRTVVELAGNVVCPRLERAGRANSPILVDRHDRNLEHGHAVLARHCANYLCMQHQGSFSYVEAR